MYSLGRQRRFGGRLGYELRDSASVPYFAQVYHQITPTPSPVLAKALLIHHARDPRNGGRVPDRHGTFRLWNAAQSSYCLECTPHSATLVFEDVLRPRVYQSGMISVPSIVAPQWAILRRHLDDGGFFPARGARWGTEYCESHIDASFGVFQWVTKKKENKETLKVQNEFSSTKGLFRPNTRIPAISTKPIKLSTCGSGHQFGPISDRLVKRASVARSGDCR